MKTNKALPRKIEVKTIIAIIVIICWCVIGVRVGVNLHRINVTEAQRTETERFNTAYTDSERLMRKGSDNLTDSVRQFAFSGEEAHLQAYFTEAGVTRNRERALELLRTVDDSPSLYNTMNSAMEQSTALMDVEYHSMRLRAEAAHMDISQLPAQVADYELPAEEQSLSDSAKMQRALDLVLNDSYTTLKNEIFGTTQNFLQQAMVRTQSVRGRQTETLDNSIREQRVLYFVFAAGIIYIAYFIISHLRLQKNNTETLRREILKQAEIIRSAYQNHSNLQDSIIDGMAKLVEGRDMSTGEHVKNTRTYVSMIVDRLALDGVFPDEETRQRAEQIVRASVLHDVGKIFISDFLLNKPGKLTQEEFDMMKEHTSLGGEIVDELFSENLDQETVAVIRDTVVHHHEKWDGSGYPDHLKGEEIPLAARIMAVADVFDALTSKRPYKEPMSVERALSILDHDKGSHFDPAVVDAFFSMRDELTAYVEQNRAHPESGVLQASFRKFEEKVQHESIISGLSNDYELIFYVKPDEDRISMLRSAEALSDRMVEDGGKLRRALDFGALQAMVDRHVYADDAGLCKEVLSADNIRAQLDGGIVKIFLVRLMRGDVPVYYQAKLIRLGKENDSQFDILIGLTDVDERTREQMRAEQELAEAKEQAEFANEAKTEFVYQMSRNLRTHVANVVGYTDLLEKHFNEPNRARHYLDKIEESEEELMRALSDTPEMESIEKGEL